MREYWRPQIPAGQKIRCTEYETRESAVHDSRWAFVPMPDPKKYCNVEHGQHVSQPRTVTQIGGPIQ